jgi:hypothetical protein
MERPWMKLFTRDWLDDLELRKCSAEARALLLDLMCLAQEGKPYGHIADSSGALPEKFVVGRLNLTAAQFRRSVAELIQHDRLSQNEEGVLFIRRMVRDEEERARRSEKGKLGGNPTLKREVNHSDKQDVSQDVKHTGARPDSDSDSVASGETTNSEITSPRAKPRGYAFDEQYADFRNACKAFGMNVIEEDFTGGAWHEWLVLDHSQRSDAIDGIHSRRVAGVDPQFVKGPKNYLKNREWKRPIKVAQDLAELIANA